jgi:DNA uptake protein ComE-like DNA-binding protein
VQKLFRGGPFAAALLCLSIAGTSASVLQASPPEPNAPTIAPESRVDINFATIDELLKVPGMTRTWAARIIRFRPYRTKLDLLERGVLTSEVYSRVQDYVIAHRTKQ